MHAFDRTELLIGEANLGKLNRAHVVVFGLGGVGSYAAEALARAPIGHLTLVDRDRFTLSNLNRQLYATHATIGRSKAEVAAERLLTINPEAKIRPITLGVTAANVEEILTGRVDYVVDAIDETAAKVAIARCCTQQQIPIVSSMGAASKLDLAEIRVSDIADTRHCPLARRFRKALRRQGISSGVQVVYSDEMPILDSQDEALSDSLQAKTPRTDGSCDKRPQGTISFLPAAFGLHCAATVIRALLTTNKFRRQGQH